MSTDTVMTRLQAVMHPGQHIQQHRAAVQQPLERGKGDQAAIVSRVVDRYKRGKHKPEKARQQE